MEVEYESIHTPGRKFQGRVVDLDEKYAIIRFELGGMEEYHRTHRMIVNLTRLKELPRRIVVHKGRTA